MNNELARERRKRRIRKGRGRKQSLDDFDYGEKELGHILQAGSLANDMARCQKSVT